MKRDMDLVRQILLGIEADVGIRDLEADYGRDVVAYHLWLIGQEQAELVEGFPVVPCDDGELTIQQYGRPILTWQGCEFLDAIRDDGAWRHVKERAATVGGDLTFTLLKALATQYLTQQLGLN